MTTISAKTILRSRNAADPSGNVLSCLLLRYPRCIHAEFMTHKMLVKNSASSRAIPVKKLIQSIKDDPFVPLHWGKNQKGMQAFDETDEKVFINGKLRSRETAWLIARDHALIAAEAFDQAGYHKQIVNRLIEPWMHITVLASGMDMVGWSNFLGLRDHEAAEPHIQLLAKEVRKCLEDESTIQVLQPGEWHTPFVHTVREADSSLSFRDKTEFFELLTTKEAVNLSTARCASTSYKTVEGFDMDLPTAIRIHDQLVGSVPMHASPAEHVAQADEKCANADSWVAPGLHAAFSGFRQYRKMLPGECL